MQRCAKAFEVPDIGLRGDDAPIHLLDQCRGLVEIGLRRSRIADAVDVVAHVDADDVGAFLRQPDGVFATLAARRSGDERDLACDPANGVRHRHLPAKEYRHTDEADVADRFDVPASVNRANIPMHVAGLQLFEPPEGSGPDFIRDMYETIVKNDDFQPTFRKHPGRMLGGIANLAWAIDDDVDIDYHLRRSGLPRPGRIRDFLELVSRLHGTLLDRHRPLWETSLVEGLEDGRFAIYTKIHHSLLDGVTAQRLTIRSMTTDPTDPEMRVPWTLGPKQQDQARRRSPVDPAVHHREPSARSPRWRRRPCRSPGPRYWNSN